MVSCMSAEGSGPPALAVSTGGPLPSADTEDVPTSYKYVEHCLRAGTRPAPAFGRLGNYQLRNLGNNILWKKLISLNSVWKKSVREVVFMEAMAELSHKTKES